MDSIGVDLLLQHKHSYYESARWQMREYKGNSTIKFTATVKSWLQWSHINEPTMKMRRGKAAMSEEDTKSAELVSVDDWPQLVSSGFSNNAELVADSELDDIYPADAENKLFR